jgi:hypothetical protein
LIYGEPWAFICGFLLLASIAYWIIRISSRQFSNHNFLYNDAKERMTMTQTFLALCEDEKTKGVVIPKEHLVIVLAALFRPSASGSGEDGPIPFYEVVANIMKSRDK